MVGEIDLNVLEILGLDAGSLVFAGIALIIALLGSFFLIYYIKKNRPFFKPKEKV